MEIIKKLKFKTDIFYNFFYNLHIRMFRNLSAKYYQENNERLHKKLVKYIKVILKKKRKKSDNMVENVTNISQKMKNKSLLSIEKILKNEKR